MQLVFCKTQWCVPATQRQVTVQAPVNSNEISQSSEMEDAQQQTSSFPQTSNSMLNRQQCLIAVTGEMESQDQSRQLREKLLQVAIELETCAAKDANYLEGARRSSLHKTLESNVTLVLQTSSPGT